MPILLSRQASTASLAAIVEKSQRHPLHSPLEYDLQLKNNQLELILLSKPPEPLKLPTTPADEGFESDVDTISLVSSENESFTVEKPPTKPNLTETDSANGGSGTESDTETEKTSTLTQKSVSLIKESLEKQILTFKGRECFNLVDCLCYTDATRPDILIFVIKNEALVFKFENLANLKSFYTNFSTLKAISNQRAYNLSKNITTKFNLLQRTDHNGITHIEIKKQNNSKLYNHNSPEHSSIISIHTPEEKIAKLKETNQNKTKDINLRQRHENMLLNDVKFNTVNNKVGQKKMITRSSSIENILHIDDAENNLVKQDVMIGKLKKVWNSAEDLLAPEMPRRPERRRKKKPAPPPPTQPQPQPEDVYSGQFVRVSVNFDTSKDLIEKNRLVFKSALNEPHPKKLGQNFNLLGAKNNLTSFLKGSSKNSGQVLRYPTENSTLNRPLRVPMYEKNSSWTNSVPRILKKSSRSKSETRNTTNFQPMAYRYIDTTLDYPYNNNAMFLTATGLKPKPVGSDSSQPRISYAYNYVKKDTDNAGKKDNSMGNRLFGLSPKLRDFSRDNSNRGSNRWGSEGELNYFGSEKDRNNLKSSIKNTEALGKKKNEKKVTFSAYTTVQVV